MNNLLVLLHEDGSPDLFYLCDDPRMNDLPTRGPLPEWVSGLTKAEVDVYTTSTGLSVHIKNDPGHGSEPYTIRLFQVARGN